MLVLWKDSKPISSTILKQSNCTSSYSLSAFSAWYLTELSLGTVRQRDNQCSNSETVLVKTSGATFASSSLDGPIILTKLKWDLSKCHRLQKNWKNQAFFRKSITTSKTQETKKLLSTLQMCSKSGSHTIRPHKSWLKSLPMHTATHFSTQKIAMRAITHSGGREDHLSLPVQKNSKHKLSFITQMSLPASKNRWVIKLLRKSKMSVKLRSLAKSNTMIFPTSLKGYINWRKLRTLEWNLRKLQLKQKQQLLLLNRLQINNFRFKDKHMKLSLKDKRRIGQSLEAGLERILLEALSDHKLIDAIFKNKYI